MDKPANSREATEIFPWKDVRAAQADSVLQADHPTDTGIERYSAGAQPCPECGTPPAFLTWFYFESPPWTWEKLCGRAGWMTLCEWCERQVDFFIEVMN